MVEYFKTCSKCGQKKPGFEFSKNSRIKDGLSPSCRGCAAIVSRAYYLRKSETIRSNTRKWVEANQEKAAETKKKWYEKNKETNLEKSKERYLRDKEKRNMQMRDYYHANKRASHLKSKKWAHENPDKVAQCSRAWRLANLERKILNEKLWREANPHVRAASTAKRRAQKLLRIPIWLSGSELVDIAKLYAKAIELEKETGIKHHVDHILPLCGKYVSGLHVLDNLQVITATENSIKSNKWLPL